MNVLPGHVFVEGVVEVFDNEGMLIPTINEQPASRKVRYMREKDQYKALIGDANARINVGIDESMGGPYGYSNVKIRVSATLTCDQNKDTIKAAQRAALDECLQFVEDHIGVAYTMLCDHLNMHYRREG